jgi:hypothetical protein
VVQPHENSKGCRTLLLAVGVGVAFSSLAVDGSSADDEMPAAWQKILAAGELTPEPESLGPYLDGVIPSQEERARIALLLDEFTDAEFDRREEALAALLETKVVPWDLLAEKLHGDQPEAVWRAKKVAQRAKQPDPVLHYAVLRVIAFKRMRGMTKPLVAGAQTFSGMPGLDDALDYALARTAGAADITREMLADGAPVPCRIAALQAFARVRGSLALPRIKKLLTADDEELRVAAAVAVVSLGDPNALTTLADALTTGVRNTRIRAVHILRLATDVHFGYSIDSEQRDQQFVAKRWQEWIKANGDDVKLKPTPVRAPLLLGRTLVAFRSDNRVVEYDSRGLAVWRANVPTPVGVSGNLAGQRVIASYEGRSAIIYDADGQLAKVIGLSGRPFSSRWLPGGSVLVTDTSERRMYEFRPGSRRGWTGYERGRPMDARRLATGGTLVAVVAPHPTDSVIERDKDQKELWRLPDLKSPRAVQRLASGNTLVAEAEAGTVTEYTPAKTVAWRISQLGRPSDCQRLPSGNTLIATQTGAYEVTKEGKVVWSVKGRDVAAVYRY